MAVLLGLCSLGSSVEAAMAPVCPNRAWESLVLATRRGRPKCGGETRLPPAIYAGERRPTARIMEYPARQ